MASRRILLLFVAGVVAVGTVLTARTLMNPGGTAAPEQQQVDAAQVIAASHDLPTGTIIKETDLKFIPWAQNADNGKLYFKGKVEISSLTGAVVREGLHADEPLLSDRVVQSREQGFLAAVLTPGMRAVAVTLTPSAEVAGFIFPGDRVDVILTHSFSRKDISNLTERHVSETVIENVRVLALDQKSDNQSTDPKVAQMATLEVTPKQAEKMALAIDIVGNVAAGGKGEISLALRSLAINDPTLSGAGAPSSDLTAAKGTAPAATDNVRGGTTWDSELSPAFPSANGEDSLAQRVQVMRGKEISESTFERHH